MNAREVTGGREFVVRLDPGSEWRTELETLAATEDITAAWFTGLGAVQDAELWYYDQDDFEYTAAEFDEPLEVAACVGNIATLDGEPFAHTHVTLSRRSGQALAGHLERATVFAGELYVRELDADLVREHDAATDLDRWL
ncbi:MULTISPECIES: PPC domain-containing DNA-binding protein [Halobacterium]|uniref:PPC domain-containing DNA-binding protein n=1 Tax=Halobacterium TaxID=2239 RepID=UPI00196348A9|nr:MULTISPECIES: PPC domain-containing DNA-binding protein [Halobacterium]MCF2164374.1 DNA-binding protein [Halobacterium salinarum]MCF2167161.1 DNA-binding protein [Halobacterium salinarum]MCF2207182.1 DNA-binding protein [Halobacterium salinarum]MCF2238626.1 DNA-binding protein [Halobacterium salinarum]MCF2241050.1 DNA-binding protein [Halobacterium salinarum]